MAAPASSTLPYYLEAPLTPQTDSSFDPGASSCSSPQLPFFLINNSSSIVSARDSSSCLFPLHGATQGLDPNLTSHADCLPLSSTFYLSPSASRSSRGWSLCSSSDFSGTSSQTQRPTMPGQIFDAPLKQRFPPLHTNDFYFSSACAPADARIDDTTLLRPSSAGSRRSERTASPLSFARWAKRHHHQHHHSDEDRTSADRKPFPKHRVGRSRSRSLQKRRPQAGAVPQMTPEEFEALPVAIQRKVCKDRLDRFRHLPRSTAAAISSPRVGVLGPKSCSRWLGQANNIPLPQQPPLAPPASARACSRAHIHNSHATNRSRGPRRAILVMGAPCRPSFGCRERMKRLAAFRASSCGWELGRLERMLCIQPLLEQGPCLLNARVSGSGNASSP